jgi:hypothetical protein
MARLAKSNTAAIRGAPESLGQSFVAATFLGGMCSYGMNDRAEF